MQHSNRGMSLLSFQPLFSALSWEPTKTNLYRVSSFPAVPLSCYFRIQSQTALVIAGKMNKHSSVQADVYEI